jgi:hypothetical protein
MGIYHQVKKTDGKYFLTSLEHPIWKFWEHGDQQFLARPGDQIYCYARVFSPARFHDELQVRWLFKDRRRGWQPSDAIPMTVSGGREQGYRGFTVKKNYEPGEWRVQIETTDNRELGRIYFSVIQDEATDPRTTVNDIQ